MDISGVEFLVVIAGQRQCAIASGLRHGSRTMTRHCPRKRLGGIHADTCADIDQRGRRSIQRAAEASGVGPFQTVEHVNEAAREMGVVLSDHFRTRHNASMHDLVDAGQAIAFGRHRSEGLEGYRAWIAKSVVLLEDIAVPEIDLGGGRFRHQVERISTGATQANKSRRVATLGGRWVRQCELASRRCLRTPTRIHRPRPERPETHARWRQE